MELIPIDVADPIPNAAFTVPFCSMLIGVSQKILSTEYWLYLAIDFAVALILIKTPCNFLES